jgi:antitoxin MazE
MMLWTAGESKIGASGHGHHQSGRPTRQAREAKSRPRRVLKIYDIRHMIYIHKMDIMEAAMQVSKWGNSLAVRLPKALVDELGLKEGDELNVVAAKDGAIEVETREARRKAALERLASLNWTLPPDYKFDRDEANER